MEHSREVKECATTQSLRKTPKLQSQLSTRTLTNTINEEVCSRIAMIALHRIAISTRMTLAKKRARRATKLNRHRRLTKSTRLETQSESFGVRADLAMARAKSRRSAEEIPLISILKASTRNQYSARHSSLAFLTSTWAHVWEVRGRAAASVLAATQGGKLIRTSSS